MPCQVKRRFVVPGRRRPLLLYRENVPFRCLRRCGRPSAPDVRRGCPAQHGGQTAARTRFVTPGPDESLSRVVKRVRSDCGSAAPDGESRVGVERMNLPVLKAGVKRRSGGCPTRSAFPRHSGIFLINPNAYGATLSALTRTEEWVKLPATL